MATRPRAGRSRPGAVKPLAGLLIADFSRVLAGPLATMTLADLGATVIKVESSTGDDTRTWGPPFTQRSTAYFESANRGKASLVLDLRTEADRLLAVELARRCDVLVENFKPGGLAKYGLDYPTVASGNPAVIYCSISGFGAGAGASLPGYDFLVQAVGGLMSITGEPDGDPLKVGVALVDVLTGKDAVIGIQAALAARQQTGAGQHVEVTLLTSLLAAMVNQSANAALGRIPHRMGNQHPSIAPYESLRCADGTIAVACGNDAQFARLAGALGRPFLATDERFATNPARVTNRADLVAALEDGLAEGTVQHWVTSLTVAGVPAGAVGTVTDGLALAESLGLAPLSSPGPGYLPQVRHPVDYSAAGGDPIDAAGTLPPPDLGSHTAALRDWLTGPADGTPPTLTTPKERP
jgi:crotonobetainyl-CoA:carnitine CoA-transferase CaiB-like acyl-CoA transferase